MALNSSQPLLSLCVPIYNRKTYLERMLKRFYEDKDLFDIDISLFISDNCSNENLKECCDRYIDDGLKLEYHRNSVNEGADVNYEICIKQAVGKYIWLLGSDDIPQKGILRRIINYLKTGDYGVVHLAMRERHDEIKIYSKSDEFLVNVNYWITFISANIFRKSSINTFDFSKYHNSSLLQVPIYINSCLDYPCCAIIYFPEYFEEGNDNANNNGYNLFEVFVTRLYGIFELYVHKNLLSHIAFNKIIKIEFREFLLSYIIDVVIFKNQRKIETTGCWRRLWKYYSYKPYAYFYLLTGIIKSGIVRCIGK